MAELSRTESPPERPSRRERWTLASHRYGIPAAGAAAAAAGGVMAAGLRAPFSGWAPEILIGTGAAVLGTSLAYRAAQRRRAARLDEPNPSPAVPSAVWEEGVCLHCSGTGLSAAFVADLPPVSDPFPPPHRPVVSSSTSAGDQIWSHWLRTDVGQLPAPLVGPIAETAYSPPRPGGPIPFPHREPELRSPTRPTATPPLPTKPVLMGPFSEEELDRMFPPLTPPADRPTVPVTVAPALSASVPRTTMLEPPGLFDDGAPFEPAVYDLALEALNPTPPHLRSRGRPRVPSFRGLPSPERLATAVVPSAECASCERALTELRRWGPCPGCLRPVCNLCLLETLWSHGRGYCAACAAENGVEPTVEPAVGTSWSVPALEDAS